MSCREPYNVTVQHSLAVPHGNGRVTYHDKVWRTTVEALSFQNAHKAANRAIVAHADQLPANAFFSPRIVAIVKQGWASE